MSFESTLVNMLRECDAQPDWVVQTDYSRRSTRMAWARLNATKAVAPRQRHVWPFSDRYTAYMTSYRWKIVRGVVLFLADFTCAECDSRGAVEVHHLTYDRFERERLTDLEPLCRRCHEAKHGGPLATAVAAMTKRAVGPGKAS